MPEIVITKYYGMQNTTKSCEEWIYLMYLELEIKAIQ